MEKYINYRIDNTEEDKIRDKLSRNDYSFKKNSNFLEILDKNKNSVGIFHYFIGTKSLYILPNKNLEEMIENSLQ